jgi:hypothetical protein
MISFIVHHCGDLTSRSQRKPRAIISFWREDKPQPRGTHLDFHDPNESAYSSAVNIIDQVDLADSSTEANDC